MKRTLRPDEFKYIVTPENRAETLARLYNRARMARAILMAPEHRPQLDPDDIPANYKPGHMMTIAEAKTLINAPLQDHFGMDCGLGMGEFGYGDYPVRTRVDYMFGRAMGFNLRAARKNVPVILNADVYDYRTCNLDCRKWERPLPSEEALTQAKYLAPDDRHG